MKSKNIKSTLFAFVIILSIFCFGYLNSLTSNSTNSTDALKMEQIDLKTQATLPDVKLVEKSIDFVKDMLPVNK